MQPDSSPSSDEDREETLASYRKAVEALYGPPPSEPIQRDKIVWDKCHFCGKNTNQGVPHPFIVPLSKTKRWAVCEKCAKKKEVFRQVAQARIEHEQYITPAWLAYIERRWCASAGDIYAEELRHTTRQLPLF